jgi:hypothetical protein
MGLVAEFVRDQVSEKSRDGVGRAIELGHWPTKVPTGFMLVDHRLVPDPDTRDAIREAFEHRGAGATLNEVRILLKKRGITMSFGAVRKVLMNPAYKGTLVFGKTVIPNYIEETIVDPETWRTAQHVRIPAGRRTDRKGNVKSDRLLARQDVLKCRSCGSRMVVGHTSQSRGHHPFYTCPNRDCARRATVGAKLVEGLVWDFAVKQRASAAGFFSPEAYLSEAEETLVSWEAELAKRTRFAIATGTMEDAATIAATREAKETLTYWQGEVGRRRLLVKGKTIRVDDPEISLAARRVVVKTTIAVVWVGPGRGADRIEIVKLGEEQPPGLEVERSL